MDSKRQKVKNQGDKRLEYWSIQHHCRPGPHGAFAFRGAGPVCRLLVGHGWEDQMFLS